MLLEFIFFLEVLRLEVIVVKEYLLWHLIVHVVDTFAKVAFVFKNLMKT